MKCPKCGSRLYIIHSADTTPTMTRRVRVCHNPVCEFTKVTHEDLEEAVAPLERYLDRIKALARGVAGKTVLDRLTALADEIRGVN